MGAHAKSTTRLSEVYRHLLQIHPATARHDTGAAARCGITVAPQVTAPNDVTVPVR